MTTNQTITEKANPKTAVIGIERPLKLKFGRSLNGLGVSGFLMRRIMIERWARAKAIMEPKAYNPPRRENILLKKKPGS